MGARDSPGAEKGRRDHEGIKPDRRLEGTPPLLPHCT